MSSERSLLVAVGAVVATAIVLGSVVPASGDDGRRGVRFTANAPFTEATFAATFAGDVSRCTFTAAGPATPCVTPVTPQTGSSYSVTGAVQGTMALGDEAVLGALVDIPPTFDYPYVALQRFVGSVTRCGTGSFLLQREGNLNASHVTWHIVPNFGRDGLAGISGTGTLETAFNGPNGTILDDAVGRIRCRGGRHE